MGLGLLSWQDVASLGLTVGTVAKACGKALLPYAPLITPAVAVVAGIIALYSIHVTRTIARKRATIDFFLKTEADKSLIELFHNFHDHMAAVNKLIDEGKPLREIVDKPEYNTVKACLNIHELIAVGVEHDVFDETVAYSYWSAALVEHYKDARRLIDFSRTEPDDLSTYISLIKLHKEWKKKLDVWTSRQPRMAEVVITAPGPIATVPADDTPKPPPST